MNPRVSLGAGALAAIGASACCAGPLVLLTLGIGGTWVSRLTALEPLRPIFVGLTLVFLALAFRKLYLTPRACAPHEPCADGGTSRRQRLVFWVVAAPLVALLAFPWYAPLLY